MRVNKKSRCLLPKFLMFVSCWALFSFSFLQTEWKIVNNYTIKFQSRNVEGKISGLKGQIHFNSDDLEHSNIDVTVDVGTIDTGNKTKDKHARGESWFDTANYPTIRFSSTVFNKLATHYGVSGTLELHGIKKLVTIPFEFKQEGTSAMFIGKFKVNRQDYGIKGNAFGFIVGDEISIEIQLPVSR